MLQITATEFKKNLGKYLSMVSLQDIVITKNNVPVAQLTMPREASLTSQLVGLIPDDGMTLKQIREERLSKYEDID
ncbi:MAG: type II toxin-antitoxin system prevent-host-death family antitoxin [Anaerolineae bacterium]|jgi:antitoxin (DNA-binding transcriptional repressor) of toxin-antitoxin stability system|nr:type II toxin-antitoxin system prevent-host-death family antitoxin [Anaerolineae bacterium]